MWENDNERLALLELLTTGLLPGRTSQRAVWKWLRRLPWTRQTSRRSELGLVEAYRETVQRLLEQVWPEWSASLAALQSAGLPPTETGWQTLLDLERARDRSTPMPDRLNRHTAVAIVGPHSKAELTEIRREALAEVDLTRDGLVRLRPNPGLQVRKGEKLIDAIELASIVGEIVLSERALRDGTTFAGEKPRGLLLVENLGPYLDVPQPEGWAIVHVPGWNTATVLVLLAHLAETKAVHFGDLDPNGLRIYRHLAAARPGLAWFVPEFWSEYVSKRSLRTIWPEHLSLDGAPDLVRNLAASGRWLEQETIVLDPRLPAELHLSIRE